MLPYSFGSHASWKSVQLSRSHTLIFILPEGMSTSSILKKRTWTVTCGENRASG